MYKETLLTLSNKIEELENKCEDLKCCGNCNHRQSIDFGDYHEERCEFRNEHSWSFCSKYEYDKLGRKRRKINE